MKYRKKPVVVEAEQYRPGLEDGFMRYCTWYEKLATLKTCSMCSAKNECERKDNIIQRPYLKILEGSLFIRERDMPVSQIFSR